MKVLHKVQSLHLWKIISLIVFPIFDFIFEYIINFRRKLIFIFLNLPYPTFKISKLSILKFVENDNHHKELFQIVKDSIDDQILNNARNKINNDSSSRVFSADLFKDFKDDDKIKIIKWALNKQTIANVSPYFGYIPYLAGISVLFNIPKKGTQQEGSKCWHRDSGVYKTIDIWTTIVDVDDDTGPFYVIPCSVILKNETILKDHGQKKLMDPWIDGRISDEQMSRFINTDDVKSVKGKAGTTLITDSASNYHKGGFCRSKERIIIRIYYDAWSTSIVEDLNININDFLTDDKLNNKLVNYVLSKRESLFFKKLSFSILKIFRFAKRDRYNVI